MKTDDPTTRSLKRAFAILRTMGRHPAGMRVADLQHELRVPRASLYRVLNALMHERMIVQDHATGLYRIGTNAMTLGMFARISTPLIHAAQPVMRNVARQTGQLCELVIASGGWRVLALDIWHGPEMSLEVRIRPGSTAALTHDYVPGLIYLAFDTPRRLTEYLKTAQTAEGRRALGLPQSPHPDAVMELIERTRRAGFAWSRQSGRVGVGRLAAPVLQPGVTPPRVAASLGIACESRALTTFQAAEWGLLVQQHAQQLESALVKVKL